MSRQNAIRMDAAGDYLSRTTNLPPVTAFTIAAWVFPATDQNNFVAIFVYGNSGSDFIYYGTQGDGTTLNIYNGSLGVDGATPLAIGVWQHLALTSDGVTLRPYINGIAQATQSYRTIADTSIVFIGHDNAGDADLDGRVADIRVWNAALSGAEIASEMRSPVPIRRYDLNNWCETQPGARRGLDSSPNRSNWTQNGALTDAAGPPLIAPIRRRTIGKAPAAAFNGTQTVAETASGADADAGLFAGTIAETPSGADAALAQTQATIAETGAGADAIAALDAATIAEIASGADAPAGLIAGTIAESGTGADAPAAAYQFSVAETGSASESAVGLRSSPIAESASGADTGSGLVAGTIAESGSGADALTSVLASTIAESASGASADSGLVASAAAESGAGADAITGVIAATVADTASGADADSALGDGTATSSDALSGADTIASLIAAAVGDALSGADASSAVTGGATASSGDTASAADLPAGFIQITLADVAYAVDLAAIGPFPPVALPYQGDAYAYDSAGGVGSIAGGTVLDGPTQGSPIGSVRGASVQPGPNQQSPTGSISGGTVLPPEIMR